jgi:CYTH domain-containing protein
MASNHNSGKEIELKYLIYENGINYSTDKLKSMYKSIESLQKDIYEKGEIIEQGYLPLEKGIEIIKQIGLKLDFEPHTTRLRKRNNKYYFTVKSKGKFSRDELEPEISKELFDKYWKITEGKQIKKLRLTIPFNSNRLNLKLEFDMYIDNRPELIIAEVELDNENQIKDIIPVGKDVTYESKYKNSKLAK